MFFFYYFDIFIVTIFPPHIFKALAILYFLQSCQYFELNWERESERHRDRYREREMYVFTCTCMYTTNQHILKLNCNTSQKCCFTYVHQWAWDVFQKHHKNLNFKFFTCCVLKHICECRWIDRSKITHFWKMNISCYVLQRKDALQRYLPYIVSISNKIRKGCNNIFFYFCFIFLLYSKWTLTIKHHEFLFTHQKSPGNSV